MQNKLLSAVETKHTRADVPDFKIGDTIIIHQRLLDGSKERVQPFEGVVIARSGAGIRENVTVRRIVQGEGVERIFPISSPRIVKIEIAKAGTVRRAKIYYLRERVGKATKIKPDVKRQVVIDLAAKQASEAAAKAAAAANKEANTGGESKRAAKRKAKAEAGKR